MSGMDGNEILFQTGKTADEAGVVEDSAAGASAGGNGIASDEAVIAPGTKAGASMPLDGMADNKLDTAADAEAIASTPRDGMTPDGADIAPEGKKAAEGGAGASHEGAGLRISQDRMADMVGTACEQVAAAAENAYEQVSAAAGNAMEQVSAAAGNAMEQARDMAVTTSAAAAEHVAKVAENVAAAAGQFAASAAERPSGERVHGTRAWDRVKLARAKGRPTAHDYIDALFTEFTEMHGDRRYADDAAVIGGIAFRGDRPVTVIGLEKGADLKDRVRRNFGSANPEGYRKALRLMKQAEKFGRPVFCIVDTAGAFCGIGAEERGQGQAIAENLVEMAGLKVPIVSLLIGEGGSGGALALAVADEVWMMENAIYSVISPEGCASILWKDAKMVKEAAECLKITADDMSAFGIVDRVFEERGAGFSESMAEIGEALNAVFGELSTLSVDERLNRRYARFRAFGAPENV